MASFTKKVFGLAGAAITFAGMAFGQAVCTQTATTNIIRAEGTTEQIAPLTVSCTGGGGAAGTISLQVFLSPALPVTSKVLDTASGKTEAVAVVSGSATQYQATVSGSTINFSGVPVPAAPFTITISNVRVNATSLSVGSGVPPSISETSFISGSAGSVVPTAMGPTQVSFAQNGLGATAVFKNFLPTGVGTFPQGTGSTAGGNNFVICNAYSPTLDNFDYTAAVPAGASSVGKSLAFAVRVSENFASAFKTALDEASTVTTTPSNTVNSGTRVTVNFANVPTGVTLYVPVGAITSTTSTAAARLTNAAAGAAFAAVTASSSTSITGGTPASGLTAARGLAAVTTTSGAGTATFEITVSDPNGLDRFDIPVFIVTASNTVPGSSTAITASVNFSPTGSTTIPNFAVGSNTAAVAASVFNTCSTSLLFPFVTNQLGFDTGLAIANTSTDPFGTRGSTAQAGTCTLNLYGSGAPSPATVTTPNVPSGTVYAQVLSGIAAGFQGYMIAQCNFQFAHAFAFITNGVGPNGGLSQGYLAGVMPDVNQVNRSTGTGESLGQ